MACAKPRQNPVAGLLNLKRKRTDSDASSAGADMAIASKKFKHDCVVAASAGSMSSLASVPQTLAPTANLPSLSVHTASSNSKHLEDAQATAGAQEPRASVSLGRTAPIPTPKMDLSKVGAAAEKIEAQLNLEILLKHQELRLIDQEMAKCQIALEQLRRCQAIPYPGQLGMAPEVSLGTGPALAPPRGQIRPQKPAAWGVTDGPYTRHYARWLIQDPEFDSTPVQSGRATTGSKKTNRGASDMVQPPPSARAQRAAASARLHSINTDLAPPRPLKNLCVYTRETDGVRVKLVCVHCQKADASSVQGFLNHVRIGHEKTYASHMAAALECGQELTAEENEQVEQAERWKQLSRTGTWAPAVEAPPVATPATPSPYPPAEGRKLVHPLITDPVRPSHATGPAYQSTHAGPTTGLSADASTGTRPAPASTNPVQAKNVPPPISVNAGPFKPSSDTPNLSLLAKKRGVTGDLGKLVTSNKKRLDIDAIPYLHPEDGTGSPSASRISATTPSMHPRPVTTSGSQVASKRPASSMTVNQSAATKVPRISHDNSSLDDASNVNIASRSTHPELEMEHYDPLNLSPHTIDTNPGLVTDHDDDEDDDDDRDSEARSEADSNFAESSSHQRSVHPVHVRVEAEEDPLRDETVDDASQVKALPMSHEMREGTVPSAAAAAAAASGSGMESMPKKKRGRPSKKDGEKK
ncbi:MAG: hypothetical protein M1828_007319 [Chrysothrix sp. TS-e1954]|nr:MAG: hypothetical protein M1828_007319 [Chrysothrix sp. TS-e1954]